MECLFGGNEEKMRDETETVKSIMLLEDFAVKRSRAMSQGRTRSKEDCFNGW